MSAESVAREHYDGRSGLTDAIARLAARVWRKVSPADLDGSWARVGPELVVGVTGAQLAAARTADAYADAELEEQGGRPGSDFGLNPSALAGIASDGRPLDSLLQNAILTVKASIASGATLDRAMAAGLANAQMIARTQVADAGRGADGVAIVARPQLTGYRRMLVGKSCSRCVILAGRFYQWNDGFRRHPRCDCIHVPAAESADDVTTNPRAYFDSLSKAEQDKEFTKAGAQAIRDGSDMNRVVNARRGAYEAGDLQLTREATTRRGINRKVRLMPEQIYKIAGTDRDEALRLLRTNGYLRGRPTVTAPRPAASARPTIPAPRLKPAPPAPRVVQGRDKLADEAARLDSGAVSFEDIVRRSKSAGWDPSLAEIGARQGFDGLPLVATRGELDRAVASGWTEVWRGVVGSDSGLSAAQINGRFRSGSYEPGRGQYGNGWYLSERRITAECYRGRDPLGNWPAGGGADYELSDLSGEERPDSLLRLAISPAARVVDYDELVEERNRWLSGRPVDQTSAKVLTDVGRFAASRGYDVVRIGPDHPDGSFYPGWEDAEDEVGGAVQWIVLNRTAVMVQRAEDVP